MTHRVHHRTCSLCDAQCRLALDVEDDVVVRVRGVPDDPWSAGHLCAKGARVADVHVDPDRVRRPWVRRGDTWRPADWSAALDLAVDRICDLRSRHGPDAVGLYFGNPNVHHYGNLFGAALITMLLGTRAVFSARSIDNLPHALAVHEMFGDALLMPVPDLDRATLLVVWGANPWVSNGGGMSSGDVRGKLRAVQERGGEVVVVDPRRTETADHADAHVRIQPGTDALLLLAVLHVVFRAGGVDLGRWRAWTDGLDELDTMVAAFPPGRVASTVGLSVAEIEHLAHRLMAAERPCLYARLGVCTQRFGGLSAWLVVVLATVLGTLDAEGGLRFATPAVDLAELVSALGAAGDFEPGATRGTGLPGLTRELPVAALPEEIETPGPGQVRGLISVAGNLRRSAPDSQRMARALDQLECHVSLDLYRNETSGRAHVLLPAASPLERDHYPMGMAVISSRNVASYSPPLSAPPAGGPRTDFDILVALGARIAWRERRLGWWVLARSLQRLGPRPLLRALIAVGPHGRLRGGALSLASLQADPHTRDLGPLVAQLPGRLRTPGRRVQLVPPRLRADLPRLEAALGDGSLRPEHILIGRRTTRSVNSWLHNVPRLVSGRPRCTAELSPADATRLGVGSGDSVRISTDRGALVVPVDVTDRVGPGVVTLPHGWGHDTPWAELGVAATHAGANANHLTELERVDRLTGTADFSVPVRLARWDGEPDEGGGAQG